jgi:hypothetical protein
MAKRMGAEVRKVASSDAVMVSHPKEVAGLITLAADASRTRRSPLAFLSNRQTEGLGSEMGSATGGMRDMENQL